MGVEHHLHGCFLSLLLAGLPLAGSVVG
jgi:hypothetical protein